jgi:hypothetical protein
MWLPARLRTALESLENAQNLRGEVQELRATVEGLESLQLAREIEWRETKEQVFRHLKRAAAIRQHQEDPEPASSRPSAATVLAMKYRNAPPAQE